VKSRAGDRETYLHLKGMPPYGAVSEDAFDAEVSALQMDRCLDRLLNLPVETDPVLRREGVIWTMGP
jgi:hypothetical protein